MVLINIQEIAAMSIEHPLCKLVAYATPLALALISQPAFAHAHLKSEVPAAKSVVSAAPSVIKLKFSEGVEPKFSGVSISGPKNVPVKLSQPTVDPQDNSRLLISVQGPMPAGQYRVNWHAVSVDGHKTKGDYSFSLK
ncbi:copper homeostasis periplasmic binding protein CopC [Paralcaligenes sp. KSB-10]|jgi:methionine-rich copper-binding protein CopC|uniref:copper homeostasis periplasmic binding protein CopC n=1 Tax=Paralcaligenes sp. KSB-10 TaxID=2901142 RepID=UPI001E5D1042|nr:copper homeostasis periplasmic binding protein CopC [Paralcaligenes sp. KSB-10]UHL65239.1 copper homeostasis periplasmic binding protein CopC [Paralcaligenes sp. KSB-10]